MKYRYILICFAMLFALPGCSSAPVKKSTPLTMNSVKAADEPCWIRTPDCRADDGKPALYFVGQSEKSLASWGRPKRASFHSAQRDAEQTYARYLAVDIKASTYIQSLLKNEHYQSQFEQTIKAKVNHTVSELVKADEYFVAHHKDSNGQPIWTVYVLIKVTKENAKKHRAAIAVETKRRKAESKRRKAEKRRAAQAKEKRQRELAEKARRNKEASPPEDKWIASVFNIDDGAAIYVNGTKINQCGFSRSCKVKLSPHFQSGTNSVRLEFSNRALFWTYGYKIFRNGEVMYSGRCGQVWVFGCSWNTSRGVIHKFEFKVVKP